MRGAWQSHQPALLLCVVVVLTVHEHELLGPRSWTYSPYCTSFQVVELRFLFETIALNNFWVHITLPVWPSVCLRRWPLSSALDHDHSTHREGYGWVGDSSNR